MSTAEHNNVTKLETQNLDALVELQRSKFREEGEVTYAKRVDRLKRLKAMIVDNKKEFATTTKREFNGARSYEFSLFSEFASKVEAIDYSIKHLKDWMKSERRKTNKPMNFLGGRSEVRYFPKGVIGIIGANLANEFTKLRDIELRVGALPRYPNGQMAYSFTWSPAGVINEYINV